VPAVDILPVVFDYTIRLKVSEKIFGHGTFTGSAARTQLDKINSKAIKITTFP
jgi:hypothetical protein